MEIMLLTELAPHAKVSWEFRLGSLVLFLATRFTAWHVFPGPRQQDRGSVLTNTVFVWCRVPVCTMLHVTIGWWPWQRVAWFGAHLPRPRHNVTVHHTY